MLHYLQCLVVIWMYREEEEDPTGKRIILTHMELSVHEEEITVKGLKRM